MDDLNVYLKNSCRKLQLFICAFLFIFVFITPIYAKSKTPEPTPTFAANEFVYAKWNDKWYLAKIIGNKPNQWLVHYVGYADYWNEWLTAADIKSLGIPPEEMSNEAKPQLTLDSSLWTAVEDNDLAAVQALIHQGADVNTINSQNATPLHSAARHNNRILVDYLLHAGADINHIDRYQQTALSWAASLGYWRIVNDLLIAGANLKKDRKALLYAIQSGQIEIVRLMIDKGIDIHKELLPGLTPLQLARNFGQPRIAKLLEFSGAQH